MKIRVALAGVLLASLFVIGGCASTGRGTVYTIDAGFFANYKDAVARSVEVQKVLGSARVETGIIHYSAVYRVYSGDYDTPQAANGDLAKLKKSGINGKAVPKL